MARSKLFPMEKIIRPSPKDKKSYHLGKFMEFPIFKTKKKGASFNLNLPKDRKGYFYFKAKKEIEKLKEYLRKNTFVAYLLGKKNSGKGTYSRMLQEIIGQEFVTHLSIGDLIRKIEEDFKDKKQAEEIIDYLERNYRGFLPIKKAFEVFSKRSTKVLLPTEFILALVKREIDKFPKKSLFIDGFPRNLDQISYSLFFRDLIGYRYDPDVFIFIHVPDAVIEKRIKYRVVCPKCQNPRNLRLLPTKEIRYDKKKKEFYLLCDNPRCKGARLIKKEGDEMGIRSIKKRLKEEKKLMEMAFSLYGIPKVLLRNDIPTELAKDFLDEYEITPEYHYLFDKKDKKVKIIEKPWVFKNDEGIPSYSLLPPAVVLSMIKQLTKILF